LLSIHKYPPTQKSEPTKKEHMQDFCRTLISPPLLPEQQVKRENFTVDLWCHQLAFHLGDKLGDCS
jgi:hypothetical protein